MNNNVYCTKHHLMILHLHYQEAIAELQEGKRGTLGSSSLDFNANLNNSPWSSIAIDRQLQKKNKQNKTKQKKKNTLERWRALRIKINKSRYKKRPYTCTCGILDRAERSNFRTHTWFWGLNVGLFCLLNSSRKSRSCWS